MTRTRLTTARNPRRGFTLIELLVVISIIAVLASLIAPAVQSARRAARKVQCLSNMRNVGVAMQNFASSNNGSLPPLFSYQSVTNTAGAQGVMTVPWTVLLLPALDNSALLKNIRNDAVVASNVATINLGAGFENVAIEVFTCPDHVAAYKKAGGLSFVVNAGHMSSAVWGSGINYPGLIDWYAQPTPGDANDIAIGQATGVIWPSVWPSGATITSSLEYVSTGDGTSTTVLMSENLQAGNWYSTTTNALGFGVKLTTLTAAYPSAGGLANQLNVPLGTAAPSPDDWFINRNLSATPGAAPRPSSQHAGGVNVIMCDGAGKFLNESMDKGVFMKLMTSNGVAYGEGPLDQSSY